MTSFAFERKTGDGAVGLQSSPRVAIISPHFTGNFKETYPENL